MPPSKYAAVMQKGLFTGARINIDGAFAELSRRRKRKSFALRRKDKRARIRRFTNEFTKKTVSAAREMYGVLRKKNLAKSTFSAVVRNTHMFYEKKRTDFLPFPFSMRFLPHLRFFAL